MKICHLSPLTAIRQQKVAVERKYAYPLRPLFERQEVENVREIILLVRPNCHRVANIPQVADRAQVPEHFEACHAGRIQRAG